MVLHIYENGPANKYLWVTVINTNKKVVRALGSSQSKEEMGGRSHEKHHITVFGLLYSSHI